MSGWPFNYRMIEQLYQHPAFKVPDATGYRKKPQIWNSKYDMGESQSRF